jgi:hypothetical protein
MSQKSFNGSPAEKITLIKKPALQSAPPKAAKISDLLLLVLNKRIRGRLRQKAGRKTYLK